MPCSGLVTNPMSARTPTAAHRSGSVIQERGGVDRLNGGVPATQVPEWVGHSVAVLLRVTPSASPARARPLASRLLVPSASDDLARALFVPWRARSSLS